MRSSEALLLSPSEIHELSVFRLTVEIFHKTSTRRQIMPFLTVFRFLLLFTSQKHKGDFGFNRILVNIQ